MDAVGVERPRVLIVDDDVRAARMLARLLTEDGFNAEVAFDGATAVARLSRTPHPDALVTDLLLPHVDGIAVATFARSRKADMAIAIVTSHPDRANGHFKGLQPSVVVLAKPVSYQALAGSLFPEHRVARASGE